MEIQDYIQSGSIESYVLGLSGADEIAEIEKLRIQYPEIEKAIDDFSLMLEKQAFANSVLPPSDLKLKILAEIQKEASLDQVGYRNLHAKPNKTEPKLINPTAFSKGWQMLAAASVILLITSASLNVYLYNRYKQQKSAYVALLSESSTLQANNQIFQTKLQEWKTAVEMMADPKMLMIKMPDVSGQKRHMATIFWNTANKDVYLMPNKLPSPSPGKQYQLWAMVDGKPVDAGMLDPDCSSVCKMKNIPAAQAFAITLEKKGGNPTPTMESLYVLGKV